MLTRRRFLVACLGAGAVATPIGWYGALHEPSDIEVVRRSILIRDLPAKLEGLTAVQISDLHLRGIEPVHLRMVDSVRALRPDLVLVTGDLVDRTSAVAEAVELFHSLEAPLGIWAVPGNWDHTANAVSLLRTELEPANVRFLINESAQIEDRFWIVGVDDPAGRRAHVKGAVRDVPNGASRILLAHSPDIADKVRYTPFDLILVGHTHGGQINLPMLSGAWLHHGLARKYLRGLYEVHGSALYVNRGIGTTGLPIRVASRPEVTLFTFHAG